MYIVTMAARMSSSVLSSEARNASAAPWKRVWMLAGMPISRCADLDGPHGLRRARRPRREVERQRHGRELAGVVDDEPRVALLDARDAGERHLLPVARSDVDLSQRLGPDLIARRGLEHDAILVRLRVDRRDQPLPERVVERIVDRRHAHAQPARRVAIDGEEGLQPAILQVARHVGQRRDLLSSRSISFGTHSLSRSASGSSRMNWNCVRLTRSSIVRSCTGCR